jgi:UDP-2,3-diacylglucosamine pyrophosphatase LpxH
MKRRLEIVVISDTHLGTYGCHANELCSYLSSIKPKILILNGDIIDIWQFRKSYFPNSHFNVLKKIMSLMAKGTKVYYLTGNHDEILRKFSDLNIGNLILTDKLILEIDDKKLWFFHGDVFDASITHAKWLAKLGGWGYDLLILINRLINWGLKKLKKEPYSLSKKIKTSVKSAVKYISNFETVCAELAIEKKYDYVICGHIHEPKILPFENDQGKTVYLNSGDWVENLTALEYKNKKWKIYTQKSILKNEDDYNFEFENNLVNQFIISKNSF